MRHGKRGVALPRSISLSIERLTPLAADISARVHRRFLRNWATRAQSALPMAPASSGDDRGAGLDRGLEFTDKNLAKN